MHIMRRVYFAPVVILLAVAALYGWFLYNPIQFDDFYFFKPGEPERFLASMAFRPRDLSYATLALGWQWLGTGLIGFRVSSLLLHAGTSLSISSCVNWHIRLCLGLTLRARCYWHCLPRWLLRFIQWQFMERHISSSAP
jgi:hypothetical protein